MRGATARNLLNWGSLQFLLTRLLRGATAGTPCEFCASAYFYSHASCEARPTSSSPKIKYTVFLLTRLLRGATVYIAKAIGAAMISTHTPLARRDYAWRKKDETIKISTHTPLARRDTGTVLPCHYSLTFLLTRLLRGATSSKF